MMTAIVYHEDYNKYDLGVTHPLIGDKPRKTMVFLREKGMLRFLKIFTPTRVDENDLLRVHDKMFVDHIKELSRNGGMLAVDTPAPVGIYDYARLAAGGTKLAGEKLFEGFHCAINPLGGFHHAGRGYSSGFCFFNDIAIAIEYLREKHGLKRFLVIDLDVHHANGTQDIYYEDPTVLHISFHQDGRTLYPGTGDVEEIGRGDGEGFTVNLPLPPYTSGDVYLMAFDEIIPPLVEEFDPEFIVYQSGVDGHHLDPLASLGLTYQTYYHLADRIKNLSFSTCNKLLVVLGGGYSSMISVKSYYNIVCGLIGRGDYIEEEAYISEKNMRQVEELIHSLKKILSRYWNII